MLSQTSSLVVDQARCIQATGYIDIQLESVYTAML